MQPPAIDACFAYAVDRYFDEILPRFLTAHYRGGGYGLVAEMLAAHDGGVPAIEAACAGIEPTRRSRTLAARVRSQCPPELTSGGLERGLLGLFSKQATSIAGEMFMSYREIDASWRVYVFADTFMITVPEAQQPAEVLLTLFHEYIHYFESFLLRSEQPLRSREEGHHGLADRPMTRAEAHARDRRILRRKRMWRGLALGVVLAIVAAALLSRFDFESEHDRARLRRGVTGAEALLGRMQALIARAPAIEAAAAPLKDAPGYTLASIATAARAACPRADVKAVEPLRWVQIETKDPACVDAIEAAVPRAPVDLLRRSGRRLSIYVRPAGGRGARLDSMPSVPDLADFPSDEATRLHAQLSALRVQGRSLKARADELLRLDALANAAQAPPPLPLATLMAQIPGDLSAHRNATGVEVTLDGAGRVWADARKPVDDRAHVIAGWVLADVGDRRQFGGRKHLALFVPLQATRAIGR